MTAMYNLSALMRHRAEETPPQKSLGLSPNGATLVRFLGVTGGAALLAFVGAKYTMPKIGTKDTNLGLNTVAAGAGLFLATIGRKWVGQTVGFAGEIVALAAGGEWGAEQGALYGTASAKKDGPDSKGVDDDAEAGYDYERRSLPDGRRGMASAADANAWYYTQAAA
jgi:hypothetical protein